MNRLRRDRRDPLLRDVYSPTDPALPSRMAARIRLRRRVRQASGAAVLLIVAMLAAFHAAPSSEKATRDTSDQNALATTSPTEAAADLSPPVVPVATDAELLAHLQNERVIVFTLADGQRQVVWLDGNPSG